MLKLPVVLLVSFVSLALSQFSREFEEYKLTHPEEFSEQYEGDIILESSGMMRNAAPGKKKWTNGVVYYDVSKLSSSGKNAVRDAVRDFQLNVDSCIRFVERTVEKNYVDIYSGSGCSSHIGMTGGSQKMSLKESGCLGKGTIQHEFLHALGFTHEQSRSDRDDHVTIQWENIKDGKSHNFNRVSTNNLNLRYAYGSLMHYGKYAFSKNGKATIVPKNSQASIGQRNGLAARDIEMVKTLYGCPLVEEPKICDCNYRNGGCHISRPAPPNMACRCVYTNAWSCRGEVTVCKDNLSPKCTKPDFTFESCKLGGGDCEGYPCDCDYSSGGCRISQVPLPGSACRCIFKGAWTCRGQSVSCKQPNHEKCKSPDKSYATCALGGGDCGGY